jgi:hypothetical protein
MTKTFATLLVSLAAMSAAAVAHANPASDAVQRNCAADYKTFCATVVPGGGRVIKCMQAHGAQLSAVCKASIAKYEAANPPKPAPH